VKGGKEGQIQAMVEGDPSTDGAIPNERDAARGMFLTTIDAERNKKEKRPQQKFRTLESTTAGPRIVEHHKDLTNLALTLDQRMNALLQEHEKDFFLAYKTHMYTVQKEIKTLRMKADHEEAKTREDTKIKELEGELDWFVTEAVRLDELCRGYKKEVDKWRAKADALDEDRRFLEDKIKGAKRQNKMLRAAAERARSSAYSALMATTAKAEAARQRPHSASSWDGQRPAAGSGAKRALEAPGAAAGVHRSVLGNEAEEKYVEAIQHLKESIVREQHTVRMLQAARASSYSQKSELEEFFLKCIDEARRELMNKRHMTMHREKSERQQALEAMLNNEDVLVALYEKLFPHRTGIARSLGVPWSGNEGHGT